MACIALTTGEPAGIGPDLIITLAVEGLLDNTVVVGDPDLLAQRASLLQCPISIEEYSLSSNTLSTEPGHIIVFPVPLTKPVTPGKPDSTNADYILTTLRTAVTGCQQKNFSAMVTGPVHKATINQAGYPFTGHTEFIAELCGNTTPVMMLMNEKLRIALATTHLPLSTVSENITTNKLVQIITTIHKDLQSKFRIKKPHIMVCGLNPHAGEQGYLGHEEINIIQPAITKLTNEGMHITGPTPADTAFTPESLHNVDAVLTMYHDQGLPVLKAQGFGNIVNITLGLPIIRTSVDHGTAFSLAGTGKAKADSLLAAIQCAKDLSNHP